MFGIAIGFQEGVAARRLLPGTVTFALLVGCGTSPAPVIEQGRTQAISAPEIISSNASGSRDRDLSADIDLSRPSVTTSSSPAFEAPRTARVQTPVATSSAGGESRISRRPIGDGLSGGSLNGERPSGNGIGRESTGDVRRTDPSSRNSSNGSGLGLPGINPGKHIVQAGDTLFSIAFQYDLDFRQIAAANGLNPPYTIFVGQELDLVNRLAGGLLESAGNAAGRLVSGTSVSSSPIGNSSAGQTAPLSWRWPHAGRIMSGFQQQTKGIDISGNVGDPVLAAGAGDVVYSGRGVQGTGNLIIIRHSDRMLSAYAHNSAMLVPEGAHVIAGQQIAQLGVNSNGEPMLHFEIRRDGQSVDPMQYLPAR